MHGPEGAAAQQCVAATRLDVLRGRGDQMATLTAWELASHLTRAHLFAPFLDLDGCNTSLFGMPASAYS